MVKVKLEDFASVPAELEAPLIAAGTLAGMPALSLPCGFAGKLPVAIQLAGLPFSENTLLAIGKVRYVGEPVAAAKAPVEVNIHGSRAIHVLSVPHGVRGR